MKNNYYIYCIYDLIYSLNYSEYYAEYFIQYKGWMLSTISVPLESEPQLKYVIAKLTTKTPLWWTLPFSVDNPKSDVLHKKEDVIRPNQITEWVSMAF